jgi:hypothetical protein
MNELLKMIFQLIFFASLFINIIQLVKYYTLKNRYKLSEDDYREIKHKYLNLHEQIYDYDIIDNNGTWTFDIKLKDKFKGLIDESNKNSKSRFITYDRNGLIQK